MVVVLAYSFVLMPERGYWGYHLDFCAQLKAVSQSMGCTYTIKGEPVSEDQIFSFSGLLPALFRRADQLCSFCLGYNLGVTFENSEKATLGVSIRLNSQVPTALRLLCVLDVLYEFVNRAPSPTNVPLDDLMSD